MKRAKGYSIVELVVVMLIIGVAAAVVASILVPPIQMLAYLPNTLTMNMLGQEAMDKIVDGDGLAKGLRFCRNITAYSANSVTFTDQDSKTVIIALSGGKLTRTINAVVDGSFLRYQGDPNITITTGRNGALFLYYNSSEGAPAAANDIRRVEVNFIAYTGGGTFARWQGKSEYTTSIRTPRFI
jgi:prepilin-type N-terminal cleavage/methylation domain-containing protein